jgi:HSP20 family protein
MDNLWSVFGSRGTQWPYALRRDLFDALPSPAALWRETRLFPLLNVNELPDSFVVTAEIPGMKTEDLEIRIEGDTLTLKGERKPEAVTEEASYHRRERAVGSFQRSLMLPRAVDPEKVQALYKNGVLTVTLTKEKPAQPKQISIKTG